MLKQAPPNYADLMRRRSFGRRKRTHYHAYGVRLPEREPVFIDAYQYSAQAARRYAQSVLGEFVVLHGVKAAQGDGRWLA